MAANGGGRTLDALIKGQPDDADPRLLSALAEGRYGMAFSIDASADPKKEMQSMKAVCAMFSRIPQDIVGTPASPRCRARTRPTAAWAAASPRPRARSA